MVSMHAILKQALEKVAPEIIKGKPLDEKNKSLQEQFKFLNDADQAILLMGNNYKIYNKVVAQELGTCQGML